MFLLRISAPSAPFATVPRVPQHRQRTTKNPPIGIFMAIFAEFLQVSVQKSERCVLCMQSGYFWACYASTAFIHSHIRRVSCIYLCNFKSTINKLLQTFLKVL
jgi:hypothetical protein